jgi:hypothetical protein
LHLGVLARKSGTESDGQRRSDIKTDILGVGAEALLEVRQFLAVVEDALALKLEGKEASGAVWLLYDGAEHWGLRDISADWEVVVARVKDHVVDVKGADLDTVEEILESGIPLGDC